MWIGSLRLTIRTKNTTDAGTDSLVQAIVLRDTVPIGVLNIDYDTENDLERGAIRAYNYTNLPRVNDQTPPLPPGIGQSPMPYPDHGYEFSHGLSGHLTVRLLINGDDMWIKDKVDLDIRQVREVSTGFDSFTWQEDSTWTHKGTWTRDVAMSTDSDEGVTTWNLNFT